MSLRSKGQVISWRQVPGSTKSPRATDSPSAYLEIALPFLPPLSENSAHLGDLQKVMNHGASSVASLSGLILCSLEDQKLRSHQDSELALEKPEVLEIFYL